MKKLLMILTVLAFAPLASATLGDLVLDLDKPMGEDGAYQVSIGEVVTVTVIQTVHFPAGRGGEMGIKFEGEVIEVVDLTPAPFWIWEIDLGIQQSDEIGGITFTKIGTPSHGTPGIGSIGPFSNPYVGTVQFSFIATGPTEFEWIGIWDGVDMTGEIGASITPEPITFALLGFGALCIRRRK